MSESRPKLAMMLRDTRKKAGFSQEAMAYEMDVARKTVQNWEYGSSEPTAGQLLTWFEILEVNPFPYLFGYIYPDYDSLRPDDDVERLRKALLGIVSELPEEGVRQLLYILNGEHGSSSRAVINMVTAHLQTPMKDRWVHAQLIESNYEIAKHRESLTNPDNIQPNMELLDQAIQLGREAVIRDVNYYSMGIKK